MDNKKEINKEQNDAFTGQSATKESADPRSLEKRWYEIEDDYRSRHKDITDDDVQVEDGKFDDTINRIAKRRGKSSQEIRNEIENW